MNSDAIRNLIFKTCGITCSPRLNESEMGIIVFDSNSDAQKVLSSNFEGKFSLIPVTKADKDKFQGLFTKEYFNPTNLRPKANKSVAIRMINGHLNLK